MRGRAGASLQAALGPAWDRVGAFVAGGFALSLRHRHDIRVGIASGMFLRQFVCDTTRRLVLLAAVFPCYWRWSTRLVLLELRARMREIQSADANQCADILQEAWNTMSVKMADYQVLGFRAECRVNLVHRTEAKRLVRRNKGCFAYHPFSSPESRRTGDHEFNILLTDIRSGSLWRACADLAKVWQDKPTYAQCEQVLARHHIALWTGESSKYDRTRFLRWLFQVERMKVEVDATDWEILTNMGVGAEACLVVREANLITYEDAVTACNVLDTHNKAASGAPYTLEDLSIFICLSQHEEVSLDNVIDKPLRLPDDPPEVTVLDDLDLSEIAPVKLQPRTRIRQKLSHHPAIASIMAAVLPELLRWSLVPAARRLCLCCRDFHASGLFMTSRFADYCHSKRNIADSVASMLSFEAPFAAVLRPGITKSTLLRMLACAWECLEVCAASGAEPLGRGYDEHLMALVLVRMSVKFELMAAFHEKALKFLGTQEQKPALHVLECRLLTML